MDISDMLDIQQVYLINELQGKFVKNVVHNNCILFLTEGGLFEIYPAYDGEMVFTDERVIESIIGETIEAAELTHGEVPTNPNEITHYYNLLIKTRTRTVEIDFHIIDRDYYPTSIDMFFGNILLKPIPCHDEDSCIYGFQQKSNVNPIRHNTYKDKR